MTGIARKNFTVNIVVLSFCLAIYLQIYLSRAQPLHLTEFLTPSVWQQKNEFLENFMQPENLAKIFGTDAIISAPIYDPSKKKYLTKPSGYFDRDVNFILHTRESGDTGKLLFVDVSESLEKVGFIKNATTKIICHGFMSNYKDGPGHDLVPAYLGGPVNESESMNIILVDWSSMAGIHQAPPPPDTNAITSILYFPPAENTVRVGKEISKVVKFLVDHGYVTLDGIHLIGHSLGAHSMGYAAKDIQKMLKDKVARFTALDPAGPCFETWHVFCFSWHTYGIPVEKSDAKFVDVIHTDSRLFGMVTAVGHVDFYPNGGSTQPECGFWFPAKDTCSHTRSIELMAQSVCDGYFSKDLLALRCASYTGLRNRDCAAGGLAKLGEYCPTNTTGLYYLEVNKPRLCNDSK